VGHDYRSYSTEIKYALICGLMATGCRVHDIGLALSPVAYFSQFALDCPAVAMITASHNENGWTGVKMGAERPLTFGPEQIQYLKEIIKTGAFKPGAGTYHYFPDIKERYIADLVKDRAISRKLKVVVACGNGTAGAYAPLALEKLGCKVIQLDCKLDYNFPRHNPNPEDLEMLHALRDEVLKTGADIGFAFDGDGDRCGVVDNTGEEIFADKMGVILSRYLTHVYDNKHFVVDVKSTGLYWTDPILKERGGKVEYWKTGHSYIKRRVSETNALAGFEKSGHYFFNAPIGRGYDDGILSAIMICHMLDQYPAQKLSDLREDLPRTWGSPTMSPHCADDRKYEVVEQVSRLFEKKMERNETIIGQKIKNIQTINGIRITLQDGTWGLVRASSNKPCLVVVVESPVSEEAMQAMFREIDNMLGRFEDVGEYDQKLKLAA
jgi:phosphomannomutase/phosphoglucomutase